MRHFVAYHNAMTMGYSCTDISELHVQTNRPVHGLEGVTVWLIAGEGRSPKSYFLTSKFVATDCGLNLIPGTKFRNRISGLGTLFRKGVPLAGKPLLERVRKESANFVRGFYETTDLEVIEGLGVLA